MNKRHSVTTFAVLLFLCSFAPAQVVLITPPKFQSQLQNGYPNAFGCVFSYATGTSTPISTFTDYTGATPNANPVVLDAGGFANIWLTSGTLYRIVIKTSGGVNCVSGSTVSSTDGMNQSLLNLSNTWQQPQIFDDPITILAPDLQIVFGVPESQTTLDMPPTTGNVILHAPPLTGNDTIVTQNATQTVTNKNFTTGTEIGGCGVGQEGGSTTVCIPNNAITATVLNDLATLTGAPSTATIMPVTGSAGSTVGVVIGGAGITGSATIQQSGEVMCNFDTATTAGDAVIVSPTVAGNCHDAGVTVSAQSIGVMLSTNVSGGLYNFLILVVGGGGGSGGGGSSGVVDLIPNAAITGTTVNTLTKLSAAPSTALIAATTDTGGTVGVTIGGAGTTGSAVIQKIGIVVCKFDAATTAGDYVQISGSIAGNCHDAGAAYPVAGQVVGRVLSTNGSGGVYSMDMIPSEVTPVPVDQHHYIALLGSPVTLSGPTTILTQAVTMPASGCPCRAVTSYQLYLNVSVSGSSFNAWATDGTATWASAQIYSDASSRQNGIGASAYSEATYANGASVTFTLKAADNNGNSVAVTPAAGAPQHSWMTIDIVSSN